MIKHIKKGILSNLVALLLSTFIIVSCMYIYCPGLIIPVSLLIFVIQSLVFSFYTYLSGKSMILRFVSVLGSFIGIIGMATIAIKTGQNKSSYDYFVWFLSPQALVTFSASYIVATFIIINFFISSTVYYFSAVRYRLSITFLITLIPFAFYRKEGVAVPSMIAFILLVLYIVLMIHCRNINTKQNQKMIVDIGYKKSIIYFLLFSSFVTFIIPKPDTNFAASVWLSNIVDSEKLSDYMLKRLGIVSTTSSSYTIYTSPANIHLYTFTSEELPLNLKSQTFSAYDFNNNSWSVINNDKNEKKLSESDAELLDPSVFYQSVAFAAEKSSEFSKKYGLEEIESQIPYRSDKRISMTYSAAEGKSYLSPVLTYKIKSTDESYVFRAENGMIFNLLNTGSTYSMVYYSQRLSEYKDFQKILGRLNMDNYGEFLDELKEIISDESEFYPTVEAYIRDYDYSKNYYLNNKKGLTPRISELAEKITSGKKSDYEKALSIENYFISNGFIYDMKYQKTVDYDIEKFLFDDKTGICADYATSMVLLARSAGIPARYAEGVHLKESPDGIAVVTDADLHAFPELFIAGYGWMGFEPTQAPEANNSFWSKYSLNIIIAAGSFLLIVLLIISYIFFWPSLSEKLFRLMLQRKGNEEAVIRIGLRIRRKISASESSTSDDVKEMIMDRYGIDISDIFRGYDSVVFGNNKINDDEYNDLFKNYNDMVLKITEQEKRRNKKWMLKKN